MKPGIWHQFGDKSQKLVLEQLEHGNGAGIILGVRDVSFDRARGYADQYKGLGAELLLDLQFINPHSSTGIPRPTDWIPSENRSAA